jgi:hypothetical protein
MHCFLIVPLLKVGLSWTNYFLLFVLIISSLHFGISVFKAKSDNPLLPSDRLKKIDYFFAAVLVIITAVISKIYINKYTVWLDESDAGFSSLASDVLVSAAYYQQPPLDYLYRRWGLISIGMSEAGLRLSSVIAYGIFVFVSFFNFLKISKNSLLSFFFAVILSLNDWIIRYAIEARPYSLGLCYFAFFSYFVICILMENDEPQKSKSFLLKDYKLAFITFFWLMSISMQPFLFLLSSVVVSIIYYLVTKNLKIKKITLQVLLGLLIFAPFQLKIVKVSTQYLNPSLILDEKIIQSLSHSFEVLLKLFTINSALFLLLVISLTIILLGVSSTPKKRIVFFCFVLVLAFTALLLLFFAFKINWPMAYRYLLLNLVIYYYLVFVAAYYYKENSHLFKKYMLMLFCIIVSLASLYRYNLNDISQVNWRGLYEAMNKKAVTKADAYVYAFQSADYWGVDGFFMAADFYDTSKLQLHATRGSEFLHHMEYVKKFTENSDREAFIAIDQMTLKSEVFWEIKLAEGELFDTQSFFVVYKKAGVPLLSFAEQFLDQLDQHFPADPRKFRLHLDLFELKIIKSKCKEAKRHLDVLSQLALPAHEIDFRKQKYTQTCK